MNFKGIIVEESLANKGVLNKVKIISTRVVDVSENHNLPWHSTLTLHEVEIPQYDAPILAEEISRSLRHGFGQTWHADFKNDNQHYIIFPFPERIFCIDRKNNQQYEEVKNYFLSLGFNSLFLNSDYFEA